jgi:hypothetical protein
MRKNEERNISNAIRKAAPWTAYRKIEIEGCNDLADGLAYILANKIQNDLHRGIGRVTTVFSQGGVIFALLPKSNGKWDCVPLGREKNFEILRTPDGF